MAGQSRNVRAQFKRWLAGRPGAVRAMARTLKPWNVYRIKETGQHCQIVAFSQNSTVRVDVIGHDDEFRAQMERLCPVQVFGIKPASLEPVTPNAR